jgi:hypothetical protein
MPAMGNSASYEDRPELGVSGLWTARRTVRPEVVESGHGLCNHPRVQRRLFLVLMAACGATAACSRPEPQACKPPRSYWQKPHNFDGLMPMMNQISLTHDGSIYWNGTRLSSERLSEYLRVSRGMNPEPNHFLQTEMGTSCKAIEALRDRMDQALECKKPYSHCSEGILSVWRNLPTPPGTPVS